MPMQTVRRPNLPVRIVIIGLLAVLIAVFVFSFSSQFFYFLERVEETEVGVQFVSGRIKNIVGPGVYSDAGLFVEMKRVSSQAVAFSVTDEELITRDKQRIGLTVTGDIFRPGMVDADIIQSLWAEYNQLYLNDEAAQRRIEDRARQAMKVCVGNRNFDDAVIGTARDELRNCIDDGVNELAANFGLVVDNVAVPEVFISPDVQAGLDAIVRSRLETEKAAQDKLKADAEASAGRLAKRKKSCIAQQTDARRVPSAADLAELERQKIEAQKAVIEAERANELARVEAQRAIIEAEKNNSLLAAERDLQIEQARALAAAEQAKAEVAIELAFAEMYALNPGYLQLQMVQANAGALNPSDKIIFTPEGTVPTLVLPGPGIVPTVETGGAQPSDVTP